MEKISIRLTRQEWESVEVVLRNHLLKESDKISPVFPAYPAHLQIATKLRETK